MHQQPSERRRQRVELSRWRVHTEARAQGGGGGVLAQDSEKLCNRITRPDALDEAAPTVGTLLGVAEVRAIGLARRLRFEGFLYWVACRCDRGDQVEDAARSHLHLDSIFVVLFLEISMKLE